MGRGYRTERSAEQAGSELGNGSGLRSLPVKGSMYSSFGRVHASREAFGGLTDFQRRTGITSEEFEADQAAQRARCLARFGGEASTPEDTATG